VVLCTILRRYCKGSVYRGCLLVTSREADGMGTRGATALRTGDMEHDPELTRSSQCEIIINQNQGETRQDDDASLFPSLAPPSPQRF
jgi:hypothetical protein